MAIHVPQIRANIRPAVGCKSKLGGKHQMKDRFLMLAIKLQSLLKDEKGQDLIEYALVVALIAMAATAGMGTLATDINQAFSSIGTKLTDYTG